MYIIWSFSGQAAVITPRLVISGLGARRVKAVAAAKHHTVVATEAGEVFTWGSNRGKCFIDIQNDLIYQLCYCYPKQIMVLQMCMSLMFLNVSKLACVFFGCNLVHGNCYL